MVPESQCGQVLVCEFSRWLWLPRQPKKAMNCQGSSTPALTAQIREPRIEIECFWLHAFNIFVGSQNIKNSSRKYIFPTHTK